LSEGAWVSRQKRGCGRPSLNGQCFDMKSGDGLGGQFSKGNRPKTGRTHETWGRKAKEQSTVDKGERKGARTATH